MNRLRSLVCNHRLFAGWIVVAAMAMRILVPVGFMPTESGHAMTMELCPGYAAMAMATPAPAHHTPDGRHGKDGKSEAPCAFSGLSAPAVRGADFPILLLALTFLMGLGVLSDAPVVVRSCVRLRPPPRGPPLPA